MLFDQFAPWKASFHLVCLAGAGADVDHGQVHLFDLEQEQNLAEEEKPVYILYPDETGGNWRVQAVPVNPESFESRKALPEAYVPPDQPSSIRSYVVGQMARSKRS
jgi:MYG1 exonuclease